MAARRSRPGQGEEVSIFLLTPRKLGEPTWGGLFGDGSMTYPGWGQTAICPTYGEDFADCLSPIAIKVKNSVEKNELIQSLRDLTEALEAGVNLYFYDASPGSPHLWIVK